jgi:hypothetical protein
MAAGQEISKDFQVRGDPEVTATPADYRARTEAAFRAQEVQAGLNEIIGTVADLQAQIESLEENLRGKEVPNSAEVRRQAQEALDELEALGEELRRPPGGMGYRDYPRLSEQLSFASRGITGAQARPTDGQLQVIEEVAAEIEAKRGELRGLIAGPIAALNRLLQGQDRIIIGGSG